MPSFVQVDPTPWPSGYGDVLALIDTTASELTSRHSLRFVEGDDDLGPYLAAPIRLGSGRRLGLLQHPGSPAAGVEVHGDSCEDAEDAVDELLKALEMSWDACLWIRQAPELQGVPERNRFHSRS